MEIKFFYRVIVPVLVLLLICTCSSSKDAELASYREYYDATDIDDYKEDDCIKHSSTKNIVV